MTLLELKHLCSNTEFMHDGVKKMKIIFLLLWKYMIHMEIYDTVKGSQDSPV